VVEFVCQTFPTSMFFGNCPQNFRTFTGHLWKVAKVQKFALPLFEVHVSARVCRRSNIGMPICLYLFLIQSTVLQIFMKVLNITFFPITLYSLRFMIHAKTKPNNDLSGAAFSLAFSFDLLPANRISFARFHVQIINKLKT